MRKSVVKREYKFLYNSSTILDKIFYNGIQNKNEVGTL